MQTPGFDTMQRLRIALRERELFALQQAEHIRRLEAEIRRLHATVAALQSGTKNT